MGLYDLADDGQTKAHASRLGRCVGFKCAHILGHADAGVSNLEDNELFLTESSQSQCPAIGHRFDGVLKQIDQDLLEFGPVAAGFEVTRFMLLLSCSVR